MTLRCPFCEHENIEGVDQCAMCQVSLVDVAGLMRTADLEIELLRRPLGELATRTYVTCAPDTPVREVIRQFIEGGRHCAIIVERDRIAGIFTERDVLNKLGDRFEALVDEPVREFMTPDPVTLRVQDPVAFALNRMTVGGYRHVPLTRDGKLAGVVGARDVLAYLTGLVRPLSATTAE